MIDPKTGHDWSEQPKPGFKNYVPRCHRCGLSSADKEKAVEQCLGQHPDSRRLAHLEELFRKCPHAQITFCDDPAEVEEHALGWGIRVEGCEIHEIFAPTFREVIDKDILAHKPSSAGG